MAVWPVSAASIDEPWYGVNMFRRGNLGALVFGGFLAELVVFVAVADRIGFGSAVLLSLAASLLGLVMLRRSGLSALSSLRELAQGARSREGTFIEGMLGALGALLLILPGFLTDLLGLVLLAPSGRQWLVRRMGLKIDIPSQRRTADARTIDLGDGDWTRIDNAASR